LKDLEIFKIKNGNFEIFSKIEQLKDLEIFKIKKW
jgi:hypothetical protein